MNKGRFLFFDLGNVLVDFDHDLMCRQLAQLVDVPVGSVKELIFGDGELMRRIEVGEIDQEECYQRFCIATGTSPQLCDFLNATGAIFSLKTDMVPVVAQLVSAKQPIGILSNTCQPHWDYVCNQYAMFPDLFDTIVLSYEVRAVKPERTIYECAAKMAGCDAEDIFFVDDRPENVAGALSAGFTAVQFTNARQFVADLRRHDFRFNL